MTEKLNLIYYPHLVRIDDFSPFNFLDNVMIFPGSNSVTRTTWEQLQAHPITSQKVQAGALVLLNIRDKADRILWVKGLWELGELSELFYCEGDDEVKAVIEGQIRRLTNARFPQKFDTRDSGMSKLSWLMQCGPCVYREAFGVPDQLAIMNGYAS